MCVCQVLGAAAALLGVCPVGAPSPRRQAVVSDGVHATWEAGLLRRKRHGDVSVGRLYIVV